MFLTTYLTFDIFLGVCLRETGRWERDERETASKVVGGPKTNLKRKFPTKRNFCGLLLLGVLLILLFTIPKKKKSIAASNNAKIVFGFLSFIENIARKIIQIYFCSLIIFFDIFFFEISFRFLCQMNVCAASVCVWVCVLWICVFSFIAVINFMFNRLTFDFENNFEKKKNIFLILRFRSKVISPRKHYWKSATFYG